MTNTVLDMMKMSGLQNFKSFADYRDTLIFNVRDACSLVNEKAKFVKSIEIAIKYEGKKRLCELVYEGGPLYYDSLTSMYS